MLEWLKCKRLKIINVGEDMNIADVFEKGKYNNVGELCVASQKVKYASTLWLIQWLEF